MAARVKICGIRTAEALGAALQARADLIGLVFFPPSPRNLSIEEAEPLAEYARGFAAVVALVVDADDALLERIMAAVHPDMLQLHGSETPARGAEIRERFGKPVMKAIKVATAEDAEAALAYQEIADLILFDARPPKGADRPGGHGAAFDWSVLAGVRDKVPFMLSGGLTPENVGEAIRVTGATAVDVSSGVETAPGIKNPGLIRAFIRAAKSAPQT
jgi:phosphoribosylanthranilate isomerase